MAFITKYKKFQLELENNLLKYIDGNSNNQLENIEQLIIYLQPLLSKNGDKKISEILNKELRTSHDITSNLEKSHEEQQFNEQLLAALTTHDLAKKIKLIDFYKILVQFYIDYLKNDLFGLLKFLQNERLTLNQQINIINYITTKFTSEEIKNICSSKKDKLDSEKLSSVLDIVENRYKENSSNLFKQLKNISGLMLILYIVICVVMLISTFFIIFFGNVEPLWNVEFIKSGLLKLLLGDILLIKFSPSLVNIYFEYRSKDRPEEFLINLSYLKKLVESSNSE